MFWCLRPSRTAYHRLLNMHDGEMPGVHIVHKDRHLFVCCVSNSCLMLVAPAYLAYNPCYAMLAWLRLNKALNEMGYQAPPPEALLQSAIKGKSTGYLHTTP